LEQASVNHDEVHQYLQSNWYPPRVRPSIALLSAIVQRRWETLQKRNGKSLRVYLTSQQTSRLSKWTQAKALNSSP